MHKKMRSMWKPVMTSGPTVTRWGLVYVSVILLLLFVSFSCSLQKPSAPSWDTNVAIPLVNKVYTMADLADQESSIILDDDGRLHFEVNADLDNYSIGDQLKLDGMQDAFSLSLGSFSVDSPADVATPPVILSEIFPQSVALHGQTVVVPPFSFQTSQKALDPYNNFSYVVIESGTISLQVMNNLAVPLGSPLTLEIWDTNQNILISSTTDSTQIPAGGSSNFVIDLAGKRLPNQLSIAMSGSSPGSSGGSVFVDKNSSFSITTSINNLMVGEASAEVPAQAFSGEEHVAITDSVVIIDAKIKSGSINVLVSGSFPLDVTLTYELPDFISPSGLPVTGSVFLPKNGTQNIPISLLNDSFQPQSADFGQQKVRFLWQASTVATGPNTLLKSSDSISANLNISKVEFYQLSGKFSQKEFAIQQGDIAFDIPADLDSLFFETARMELSVKNGINFPANIELTIEGQNEAGSTAMMAINESIQAASAPGVPVTSVIVLDQQNSNIKDFIRILPNLLRVSGKVIVGDSNLPGIVSEDDFVSGSVKVTAPFTLKLTDQIIETDAIELDIDEGVRNDIIKHLAKGSLSMEIINHLPVGASVEIVFSQNEADLYENPVLQITAIRADAGSVGGSGAVQSAITSENQIDLTEEQMRTFLLSPLHAGLRISLDGTNDKFVMLNGSDYIHVKSFTRVNVTVNQD